MTIVDTANVTCVMEQAESKPKRSDIEYTNDKMEYVISQYVHSERDRNILRRWFIDGKLQKEIADEYGLTIRAIRKIIVKHEAVLFRHLLE